AVEDVKDRVLECMGRDVHDALYPTYAYPAISGVVARGYFSEPSHSQRTSKNIYTFVNGRYVDDATIRAAINKAYGTLLDGGRYPSVILFVEVPFDLIDVNVHPMKTEVRFKDTQPVFRAVYHAIGDALAESPWVEDEEAKVFEMSDDEGVDGADGGGAADQVSPGNANFEPLNARDQRRSQQGDGAVDTGQSEVASPFYERSDDDDGQTGFSASEAAPLQQPPTVDVGQSGSSPPEASETDAEEGAYFSTLRVLGQFKRQYIVCEDKNGLVVIDQHAAHERIGYERLRRQYHEADTEAQSLLFGQRIELDAVRSECLDEHLDFFEEAGFEIEHFGGQSYAIKSVPAMLKEF
ncbi:MAG: DNA mismatch repair endonuclease MutL, partial [Bradymonadaceae bacterium]